MDIYLFHFFSYLDGIEFALLMNNRKDYLFIQTLYKYLRKSRLYFLEFPGILSFLSKLV